MAAVEDLSVVKSDEWKRRFLLELKGLPHLDEFVARSRAQPESRLSEEKYNELLVTAAERLEKFDRGEITAARQYYNNEHLVHFWRYLRSELQKMIDARIIDPQFPVFNLEINRSLGQYRVQPFTRAFFDTVNYKYVNDKEETGKGGGHGGTPTFPPGRPKKIVGKQKQLDRLFLKLSLLNKIHSAVTTGFYDLYLLQQQKEQSVVWDHYRIHCFLDNFLYQVVDGSIPRSPFEFVFLNSDLYELKVFLQDRFNRKIALTVSEVQAFLERQRQFNLIAALEISLEDNEIH